MPSFKTVITKPTRTDFYEENEVLKIVNAQKARSAQSFQSVRFEVEDDSDYDVYVYAFTTKRRMDKNAIENVWGKNSVIGTADFITPSATEGFDNYAPQISGSIRMTFEKKKS